MCAAGERKLGKPGSLEGAMETLALLQGRTHELITSVCVLSKGEITVHTDRTKLTMHALNREQIRRYVAADRPVDCAGAYKFESHGIRLFRAIECRDESAIMGLPLMALSAILSERGFPLP